MSTPNPMPLVVNIESAVQTPTLPSTSPSEADLNKWLCTSSAKLYKELLKDYKIVPSIGEDGREDGRKMLADLRAGIEMAPRSKLVTIGRDSLQAAIDQVPDGEPEQVFEFMVRRLVRKDVLQPLMKMQVDYMDLVLANGAGDTSDEDLERYEKQRACISQSVQVFDDVDYRDNHPVYLAKIMELDLELESLGPLLGPPPLDYFRYPKYY